MAEKPTATHRGENITFDDFYENWEWQDYKNASLKKVKEYIDKAHKNVLTGRTAFIPPGWREEKYSRVIVTSCDEDGKHYWIKNARGRREKVRAQALIADIPENELRFQEIAALSMQIETLGQSRDRTESELIRFTSAESGDSADTQESSLQPESEL